MYWTNAVKIGLIPNCHLIGMVVRKITYWICQF